MKHDFSIMGILLVMRILGLVLVLSLLITRVHAVVYVENVSHIPARQLSFHLLHNPSIPNETPNILWDRDAQNAFSGRIDSRASVRVKGECLEFDFPQFSGGRKLVVYHRDKNGNRVRSLLREEINHGESFQLYYHPRKNKMQLFIAPDNNPCRQQVKKPFFRGKNTNPFRD